MAFPTIDISREDGERGEGSFWLLHPKGGGKGAAEIGRLEPLERTLASLQKLGGHSSLIERKQGLGYRCAVSMAAAVLGAVE